MDDIRTLSFADLLDDSQIPTALATLEEIVTTGRQDRPTVFQLRRKDGVVVEVETRAALMIKDGQPVAIQGIARDITERRRAEEALRESEQKFRLLAEHIAETFWLLDLEDYQVLYVSPAYEDLWGRTCESLYENPRSWLAAVHPADLERVSAALEKQAETGEFDEEFRIIRPDGSIRWVWDRGFAVKDKSGQVRRMVGVAADITERKRAEEALQRARDELELRVDERTAELRGVNESLRYEIEERKRAEGALRESEERYRMLYNRAPVMLLSLDKMGRIAAANDRWLEVLGYERSEVIGRNAFEFLTDQSRRFVETISLPKLRATGSVTEEALQAVRKGGEIVDVLLSSIAEHDAEGNIIGGVAVLEDVTEHNRMQEALLQAKDELETRIERKMSQGTAYGLTFRESTVLSLVAEGQSDKEIALALAISPYTVSKHVASILLKMSAHSRTEAGVRAVREGLVG